MIAAMMERRVWRRYHEWVGDTIYRDRKFYTIRKCLKCGWSGEMGLGQEPAECEIGEFVPYSWLPLKERIGPHLPPTAEEYRRLKEYVLGQVGAGRAVLEPEAQS